MKKFHFRLQKLMQIKQHLKLQKQKALAQAERLRRMEEAHLRMLQEKMERELEELSQSAEGRIDATQRNQSVRYQQRLKGNMTTQTQVISEAVNRESAKREELVDATKEEKKFEKLKGRQEERYLKELDRTEQKDTDEIAKNVFRRGKGTE